MKFILQVTLMKCFLLPRCNTLFYGTLTLVLLLTGCDLSSSKQQWQLDVYNPISRQKDIISQANISHKLLLINYWAEWCKPCIEEMPELNRFAASHQDEIVVLSVNFDNKQDADLQAAIQKVRVTFPVITSNPAKVFTLPEVSALPTTLILDENGALREQLLGPQNAESLQDALHRLAR